MSKDRILFVNDDPDIVKALSPILRARNYLVSAASGGEEGLQKAKNERPDLILLEIKMPDINGYDVCRELRSNRATRNIPVIMISANGGSDSILKARSSGASDYIVKPFDLFTLLSKLRKFLAG